MSKPIRAENFDLARYLNKGHDAVSEKLKQMTNSNYISKMASGERPIPDTEARTIEGALELPRLWLDRRNTDLLRITPTEYRLWELTQALPESAKAALIGFLETTTSRQ